jgi:hypothetical protein
VAALSARAVVSVSELDRPPAAARGKMEGLGPRGWLAAHVACSEVRAREQTAAVLAADGDKGRVLLPKTV